MHTSGDSSVRARGISGRKRYGVIVWLLALGIGVLGACASKQSAESRPPEAAAAWQADASVEDLERALSDEEQRLRAAGIALPTGLVAAQPVQAETETEVGGASALDVADAMPEPMAAAPREESIESSDYESRRASRQRCNDVCDLAASICDLEQHICSLATRHAGETRYAAVCERASGDCDAAQEACNACE